MRKGLKKAFEEIGKHFLNIAVAIVVFAILQPIIKKTFDIGTAILFIIAYFVVMVVGTIFIIIGGSEDEQ